MAPELSFECDRLTLARLSLSPAARGVYLRGGHAGRRAKKQKDRRAIFSALGGSQFPIFSSFFLPIVEGVPLPGFFFFFVLRGIKQKSEKQRAP